MEAKPAYRWWMLLWLVLVSLFVNGICTAVMPALFDEIGEEMGLRHAHIGAIWGALALGGLLTSLIGGALGDRFGIKRIIGIGLLISVITCALRAVLPGFAGLTAAMLLFGMASGFIYPNMSKAIGAWFGPGELGRALGAIIVGAAAGYAVALMSGAALSSLLGGWKNVMWLTSVISLGSLIMWMALARERPAAFVDKPSRTVSAMDGLRRVLHVRDLWIIALIQLCVQGVAMAAVGLLPETLEDRGLSASMAGMYVSISTWTVMLFNVIGPYFSDKYGLRKVFIWPFLLVSAAAVTLLGVFMGVPLVLMIIMYSIGLGTALPLFPALIIENERIGHLLAGSALGVIGTVAGLGAVVIPVLMGVIMDATGVYWPGFLLLAALMAAAAVLGVVVKETGPAARGTGMDDV